MMVNRVHTFAFQGISVMDVDVQVHLAAGLPAFTIVGLPDKAVGESRERVRAALQAMGLALPPKRITINLSPADVTKEGSHYDVPIALGVMAAMGVLPQDWLYRYAVLGELALDGRLTAVSGMLPAAIEANAKGLGLICPKGCGAEAAWAGDMEILAPESLTQLVNHVKGTQILTPPQPLHREVPISLKDMKDIKGQESAKRALEVAAAGGHNILFSGPPGAGKSMLASRLPTILPPLSPKEALEVSMIYSIAGHLKDGQLVLERPYRDPHHSASLPSLVGGGFKAKPGEISLSHHGVLFLDELPEFSRATLEALRQPMETGEATIARANAHVTYPARFQLVAAMNPCRCGHLGNPALACNQAPRCGATYQAKISGPILDRIDIQMEVMPVPITDLASLPSGEASHSVKDRIIAARDRQHHRYHQHGIFLNSAAEGDTLKDHTALDSKSEDLILKAADHLQLSARGYTRILKVARTLADLDNAQNIQATHIAEAINMRRLTPHKQAA
jgi:magnesium chelatase family protein